MKGVSMERLTKRDKVKLSHGEEIIVCNHSKEDCNDSCMKIIPCKWYDKVQEKLKEYEDAEEQGLLLRLPCKVGAKVYAINRIIDYGEVGDKATYSYSIIERKFQIYMMMGYGKLVFGKSVFLTREEAEQALKQMGE